MSIIRQFMQAEFLNGYAQALLAALENEAKRKDQIRILDQPKPTCPSHADKVD